MFDVFNIIELAGKILDGHEEQSDKYSLCEQVIAFFEQRKTRLKDKLEEYQEYQ